MGTYAIFLLIFGVIPHIQCKWTPGKISSSMSITTANKHGVEKNNDTSAEIISFDEFKLKFNKKYETEAETKKRQGIFQKNVKIIEEHNKLYESGKSSFDMGVNKYSDMNLNEIVSNPYGFNEPNVTRGNMRSTTYYDPIKLGEEPSSKDWLGDGNPVRDQGDYSTCYSFAAVDSIESAISIKYKHLQTLSQQYLIDCDSNVGCPGGWPTLSIDHVMENGIAFESGYAYAGTEGTCNENTPKTTYKITRKHSISPGKDDELKNALVHIGPAAVVIYMSSAIQNYNSGVLDNACNIFEEHTHAVALVGYGTEKGEDYWLLKNSWGSDWANEGGYIKLSRKTPNHCMISSYAVIPSGAEKFLSSKMILILITSLCIMINKISVN